VESIKGEVWTRIVEDKIRKQAEFLQEIGSTRESELLFSYIEQLEYRDETNREGHAAKVYFNALFGMDFSRNDDNATNAALNYGYALILSAVNREVAALGYHTELGLFHDNLYNPYNLSCDFMEPWRILVDRFVYEQRFKKFEKEEKHKMLEVFQLEIRIGDTKQVLPNGMRIYVRSIFDALCEQDTSMLLFYKV
jgi:CRISPR-associated endonuclease Cas1 subtype II